jgi:hypothetical protein
MWTLEQRKRLSLENQVLIGEGFDQFQVYRNATYDSYSVSGYATANSGRQYYLYIPIPTGYPYQRPPLYVTDPNPLLMCDGRQVSSVGVSHYMHTLTPHATAGWPQICHWRDARWHSGIVLQKVFLKGLLWIEAYEQHLATGRGIADFVRTMTETA